MYYVCEGVIAAAEYAQAARRMMLTRKYMTSLFFGWILSIFLLIFLGKFATIINLAVYAFLFLVLFFAGQWFLLPFKFKKDLKKHPEKAESKKWILTDSHCEIISESVSVQYAWHNFSRLIQSKDVVLLVMKENTTMSILIPLRLFGAQKKNVVAEIEKKIYEAAAEKKSGS